MDSLLDDSVFDVTGASSDFEPAAPKAKAKPAAKPKKAAAAPKAAAKEKAAPKPKKTQTILKPTKAKAAPKKSAKPDSDDENEDDSVDKGSVHDDSLLSVTPPSTKKQKKGPRVSNAAGQPLADLQNEALAEGATEKYQKLTALEHIIKRPDTYIGSVEHISHPMWVFNSEKECMEFREISYVPGLYKIFDEILVNAADNKQNDKNMDTIKVNIDREHGEIKIYNNGRGIPIEIHKKEKIYIPEMVFGHLLTSSNYNDDQQKVTGGRNGYGAKLCNVFSTTFSLKTADSRTKQLYKQTWTDNMTKVGPAKITAQKGDDYTEVTFKPDFARFKMDGIDDSLDALLKRRVYDMAGTLKGVKVYLNGARIKIKGFKEYMEMYTKAIKNERGEEAANDSSGIITDTDKNRWEVGFAVSDGSFQQISFVNSIATTSGGTHVNYIADQICTRLIEHVKKKNKGGPLLKPGQIRNHIFVFVNAQIVNPAFTSQTKEQLTTKVSQFGSKFECSDDFLKKIISKTEVVTNILSFAQQKADQILKKTDGNKRSRMDNPKLTDANRAGTKDGWQCTLILTEGDSAKGLAMTGRSIVGPDLFGVFPLRGKLLNVRDASIDQISKNAEIQNIKNILGLKHKQVYEDCKSLRYGHIMIMTDQDHDGSHIKGLLINFLQVQYPSLLKIPQFLIEFITPIVKVYKGDPKRPKVSHTFFTMPEYEAWKEAHAGDRSWETKYYKGLGTSNDEDAERYFRDLDKHLKEFHAMQDSEPELIELAFSKKKADERKEWLRQFRPGTYLDHSTRQITYTDFVNKELILFSMADNMRSIPSVVDGFKPGQRKVLFACMKRNIKKDIKVVELAGYVMGITAYHHGEASLQQTIVGLAQTFVGSNNINCLEPSGNFGSRLQGGSDSASARYIFTRLSPFARRVFHPLDEPLLKNNTDDDKIIEPEMYVPVVPMILVNGADGIGTGWSSSIPNYNPADIVANLKRMMKGEEPQPMLPWFRDFEGTVEQSAPDRFEFTGKIKQVSDNEVEITELPIRVWTQDYKDRIVDIIKGEKSEPWIKDYDDYNTKQKVRFVIRLENKHMKAAVEEGLETRFKLKKTMATSNLVAFDAHGRITKYANVEEILKAFYEVRIKFYEKRKAYQLNEWGKDLDKLSNQARFVKEIIDGKLVVAKKKKADLVVELKQKNYTPYPKVADATKDGEVEPAMEDESGDKEVDTAANAYDYLLGMAIWSLTKERVDKLLKQIADKQNDIDELIKLSREDLWCKDLDEFLEEWNFQLADEKNRRKKMRDQVTRGSAKLKTQVGGKAKKRKNNDSDDEDFAISKKAKKEKADAARGGILSHLKPIVTKPKAATSASSSQVPKAPVSKVEEPVKKEDVDMSFDGASDSDAFLSVAKEAATKTKAKPAAAVKKASSSTTTTVPTKGGDDDAVMDDSPARTAKTGGRAAARKPVKYSLDTDSDAASDDGDFDVSKMVKGIGEGSKSGGAAPLSRPLFASSTSLSRPGSSAGISAAVRRSIGGAAARDSVKVEEDGADETDYAALAPPPTAAAPGLKGGSRAFVDEDEENDGLEDSMDLDVVPTAAAVPTAVKKAGTGRGRPAAAAAVGKEKAVSKKAAAAASLKKTSTTTATKPKASAAAKAPAAKKKSSSKKNEEDAEDLADAILDDDDDDDDVVVLTKKPSSAPTKKSSSKPAAVPVDNDEEDEEEEEDETPAKRPARRAAAAASKKAWLVESDDDDEDEDGDSEGFDDDDDDD